MLGAVYNRVLLYQQDKYNFCVEREQMKLTNMTEKKSHHFVRLVCIATRALHSLGGKAYHSDFRSHLQIKVSLLLPHQVKEDIRRLYAYDILCACVGLEPQPLDTESSADAIIS